MEQIPVTDDHCTYWIYCTYWNISETPNQEEKESREINPEVTHASKDFKVVIMNMFKDFQENMVTMH